MASVAPARLDLAISGESGGHSYLSDNDNSGVEGFSPIYQQLKPLTP
jgi:hypothetical protein